MKNASLDDLMSVLLDAATSVKQLDVDDLLADKSRRVYYNEPVEGLDANGKAVVCDIETSVSVSDAIAIMRKGFSEKSYPNPTEKTLLQDFMIINWACTK
jgi:hypothetical protein